MATDPTRDGLEEKAEPFVALRDDPRALREKADRCRRLAAGISDKQASEVLIAMARRYEAAAGVPKAED